MVVDTSDLTDDAAGTGSGKAASIQCATAGNKAVVLLSPSSTKEPGVTTTIESHSVSDAQNYSLVPRHREARTAFRLQCSSTTQGSRHHSWSHKLNKRICVWLLFIYLFTALPVQQRESRTQIYFSLCLINGASVNLQAPLLEFFAQASLAAA